MLLSLFEHVFSVTESNLKTIISNESVTTVGEKYFRESIYSKVQRAS